jgi:actin-like ATPase involved in cell morphogenesis
VRYALGVDVGTTFTAAATWRDGRAETFALGDRANAVPSVLFLRNDGVLLVGDAASRRAVLEPGRVAREFKRRIGDPVPLLLDGTEQTPQALTAAMIRWVVDQVTEREGEPPDHVTLTCPASWGEHRRGRMTEAAGLAGLHDVGLLTEPGAAAIYYATQERLAAGSVVAVYDLGGGTFDATLLRKTEGGFELMGRPVGDDSLGGVDFDQTILDHVITWLGASWTGLDVTDPTVLAAAAQVRANVVDAKEALSSDLAVGIPVIVPGRTAEVRLTRGEFEDMVRGPLLRTVDALRRAVEDSELAPGELSAVLLAGGSSRIPLASELLANQFRVPIVTDAHPKFAVCLGAAIAAGPRIGPLPTPAPQPVEPAAEQPPMRPAPPRQELPRLPESPEPAAPHPAGAAPAGHLVADAPTVEVNLIKAGLREPGDIPLRPAAHLAGSLRPVIDRDVPLRVMVGADDSYRRGALRRVLVIAVLMVLLVAAVSLLAALRSSGGGGEPVPTLVGWRAVGLGLAAPLGSDPFPEVGTGEH